MERDELGWGRGGRSGSEAEESGDEPGFCHYVFLGYPPDSSLANHVHRFDAVLGATEPNVGATGNSDLPNRIASGTLSNPSINEWFDVNAFVGQPLYTAGNAAPYLLCGPDQKHLDISLSKNFPIKGNWQLQFRAESYNITNTPSFASPDSALGNAAFGTIGGTLGTPRQIQLALKLLF